jgi:hypothetical protein
VPAILATRHFDTGYSIACCSGDRLDATAGKLRTPACLAHVVLGQTGKSDFVAALKDSF